MNLIKKLLIRKIKFKKNELIMNRIITKVIIKIKSGREI